MQVIDNEEEYIYANICKENNHIYIGKTSREVEARLYEHIQEIYRDEHIEKLQYDYSKYREKGFIKFIVIKSREWKFTELLLIELFSRIGKIYNKNSGQGLDTVLSGKTSIPSTVYVDIEEKLRLLCEFTNLNYNESLKVLFIIKAELEQTQEELKAKDINSIPFKMGFNMYNLQYKRIYLAANYNNLETQKIVRHLLKKANQSEIKLGKDLYNFTFEEAEEFLFALKSKTLRSFQNYIPKLRKYLRFAIEQNLSENKVNYYDNLGEKEKALKYLSEEDMIFDKDEIMAIAKDSPNAQDGVIIAMLFDGVSYKDKFKELIELTKDEIDFDNNIINLEDRSIPMSEDTVLLVKGALDQERKYVNINGYEERNYNVIDGINVLRGSRKKGKVKPHLISERILRVSGFFDYPELNATTVSYSGQLYYAKELMENGRLSIEEVIPLVLNRFGVPDNTSSRFYLRTRIKKYLENEKNDQ